METIKNMFEHLHWGNQGILKTLQTIEGENKQVYNLFAHTLLAEQVWFTRLKGLDSSKLPIWAEVNLEECEQLVNQNHQNFKELLSGLSTPKVEQIVSYKNSKGKEFNNSVRDILTHVALHGQYHRGQINLLLRANEFEPVNVDFITFKR
ncbi:DinB family protein [Neobacillus drentensis]|uniref:DinB family protein n=1 Tax=Neobacillus drentensis TaxID=220684 RepID=UPI002855244C|nr:DinB family protein [Neobacillus drentensis]MDR7236930.1 putative damage-inducible protein DinB [Neobacillus drentensis]